MILNNLKYGDAPVLPFTTHSFAIAGKAAIDPSRGEGPKRAQGGHRNFLLRVHAGRVFLRPLDLLRRTAALNAAVRGSRCEAWELKSPVAYELDTGRVEGRFNSRVEKVGESL